MYQRILFPTDGSENSKRTLEYVIEFAQKYDSEVIILHTYEHPDTGYGLPGSGFSRYSLSFEIEENLKKQGLELLETIKSKFEANGIKNDTVIEKGDPGNAITNLIDSAKCNLVIMGSHGLGTFGSILLGSTSNYVIHHTKCPVILIH